MLPICEGCYIAGIHGDNPRQSGPRHDPSQAVRARASPTWLKSHVWVCWYAVVGRGAATAKTSKGPGVAWRSLTRPQQELDQGCLAAWQSQKRWFKYIVARARVQSVLEHRTSRTPCNDNHFPAQPTTHGARRK